MMFRRLFFKAAKTIETYFSVLPFKVFFSQYTYFWNISKVFGVIFASVVD